ncbi:MAG: hypothetical protein ABL925_10420 [Methylococcales bacterium]
MKKALEYLVGSAVLAATVNAQAHEQAQTALQVALNDCTEFVGVAPVSEAKARALVPARYQLVSDAAGAKMVVRISDCKSIVVNNRAGQPGTVAHIGIIVDSPDGTATDPNTSINNYTLTYVSNVPALVSGLRKQGLSAGLAAGLAHEVSPTTGTSEFYAAVSADTAKTPTWFLHGTVANPQIASEFLANWWYLSKKGEVKMATSIPLIYFDFSSTVSFYTSRLNVIGELLGSNSIANFPLSFRGQFSSAQMTVTRAR